MATPYPATHDAVVIVGKRQPLEIKKYDTAPPGPGELVVHVQWTASSPLNLHQADGGLLTTTPSIPGDTFAGLVVASGPEDPLTKGPQSPSVQVGDRVMGFTPPSTKSSGFQTYVTVPRHLTSRIPSKLSTTEAATVPSSLTTAIHAITNDLQLELPWPLSLDEPPQQAQEPILVWGAAGSVGLFAVQVLRHWGYKNVLAVASSQHHEMLRELGAKKCFNYRENDVTERIKAYAPNIRHILDCIGHAEGTLQPLSEIARHSTKVAIMLPVILRDATDQIEPQYTMEPATTLSRGTWAEGVELRGVRTFFYEQNEFLKKHLQPDIIPALLESGAVKPTKTRVVEGGTLIERAQAALDLLRQRATSGERLVWRVADH